LIPQPAVASSTLSPRSEAASGVARDGIETRLEAWVFRNDHGERLITEQFGVKGLEGYGLAGHPQAICAAGALLHYLRETSAKSDGQAVAALGHLDPPHYYEQQDSLVLDPVTVRNLEIVSPLFADDVPRGSQGSGPTTLLSAIDGTETSMGARLLRAWLLRPEVSPSEIEGRLDAVAELKSHTMLREEIRQNLRGIQDLERLAGRATLGVATPRDLVALRQSLARLPVIRRFLANCSAQRFAALHARMDELIDLRERLEKTIAEDPPALPSDPGVIRRGVDAELDELRDLGQHGRQAIAAMEERERKRTGIASLKIRYNQVFGFYFEVSKPNLALVPSDFERKQTLVNAERFTTPELTEYERKVLAADERIAEIERRLFCELRTWVAQQSPRIRRTALALAQVDVLADLARLAAARNYHRPEFTENGELCIVGGRHPVIEQLLDQQGQRFVPNSLYLNDSTHGILLITGPNMGGKSTYLRQTALIVLLAQIGSFVPAESARLPLTDRIFTRIGASDNLARGRSTFLVEMSEVAAILNLATSRSLVLLDEVGRGTATFDGLAIAWAVVEHLQGHTRARTLFATHYHELTELADLLPGIKNVHVAVEETPNEIVFLRRVEEGSADKSYGIEVARLAGLPRAVIQRAREVLLRHEQSERQLSERLSRDGAGATPGNGSASQQALFTPIDQEALDALRSADLDQLRPLDALNLLAQLKKQIS
jgi:DNA mismatch repair protein MutS